MTDSMRNRRSIRKYSDKEITDELLNELLGTAAQASNTGNMQMYSVVATRDSQIKQQLAPAHFNQPMITSAPLVLTFCADLNRFTKWCKASNAQPGYDNFQTFIAATIDSMLFAQSFCNAAEEKGLGICYLGTTTYNAGEIISVLDLPYLVVPITTITVGYPEMPLPAQSDRLPLEAILHKDKYADYTMPQIKELYRAKEQLEENINFVKINNKESLAQIFTDIRYTKANNELFSDKFIDVLKKQGFLK